MASPDAALESALVADADPDQPDAYSHLAPELRGLPADARAIWGDPDARRGALEAILDAGERRDPGLDALIRRVDDAVVQGLAALGFPRGEFRAVELDIFGRNWAGRKRPDCTLLLDAGALGQLRQVMGIADAIFKTWVHESLHARAPYSDRAPAEYGTWRGYEEGLAEGLARLIVNGKAGMMAPEVSYDAFVRAYRALAVVVEIDVGRLWTELWSRLPGEVRAELPDVVDALRRGASRRSLTLRERTGLRMVGDRVFASGRTADSADADMLERTWRAVFR